jgi:hypothetical protein
MGYYDDKLMHYGVKGMKWGVRRRSDQPTFRQASKKARADGLEARKAARNSGQLNGIGAIRKGNKIQRDAAKASLREAKADIKKAKVDAKKSAVKDYSKKVDAASKASDVADAKWNQVKEQRKKLGKNAVSRFIASAQNKTADAKEYNKMFEDASRLSDKADAMLLESQEAYKKTGRTYVSRILNNARYGR